MSRGQDLQKLPQVKAWKMALEEMFEFGTNANGTIKKIPKKGTAAYKKLKKRQAEIMKQM